MEFPEGVTSIESSAFSSCGFERLEIPEEVTSIGYSAFSGCQSLVEVKIPETVETMGNGSLEGCRSIKYIYMGATADNLYNETFWATYDEMYMFIPNKPEYKVEDYVASYEAKNKWGTFGNIYIWKDVPHQHGLTGTVEDNTMELYCNEETRFIDCKCYGVQNSKTLTLNATDVEYDGTSTSEVTWTADDDFPVDGSSIQVLHYNSQGLQLDEAPTAVGRYTAKITIDTMTIEDEYEIYSVGPINDTEYRLENLKIATLHSVHEKYGSYNQLVKVPIYTYESGKEYYYFLIDKDTNMPYSQPTTTDLDALKSSLDTFVESASESEIGQFENKIYGVVVVPHTHTPTHVPALAPTCTATGNQEYYVCSDPNCGEFFEDQACTMPTNADAVKESNLGHDMSEATCTDAPKCKREGCDYTEGNLLDHTYGDAVFNWAADYSTATATCTCQNDSSHVLSAQCTVTSEVIKEATATEKGKIAYTATVDMNQNTYTDVKMVETSMLESETPGGETPGGETPGTETPDGDEEQYIDYDDIDMEIDDVLDDAKTITLNEKLKVTQTGSQFNIKWGRIKQADGYDIYVQRCGKNFKSKPTKTVKGNKKTSIKVKKLDGKKINLTKSYKVRVIAYKYVDGKKVVLAKSLTAHVVGRKNKKYTNVKSVKVEKSKYTIKVGKTKKIKASVKLEEKGKKQISTSHTAHFRYVSSDKSVATVSKNGKIKAVGKGTCDVYVYGKNGCGKKIKVTVK